MEMEEERIGMVLVRVSELRSKIANCIHKSGNLLQSQFDGAYTNGDSTSAPSSTSVDEADEQTEALLNICYAFDSLESQLSSLQAVRLQQQYEREAVIGDIEYSRKMLLKQLGEYKGEPLDVIQEAETFASMKVEHDTELVLPPYPTRSPHSMVLDSITQSRVPFSRKLAQNQNGYNGEKEIQSQRKSNKLWGGLRFLVHSTAKTMLTLVGVISLLSLAGFEPRLKKKGSTNVNVLTLFQQPDAKDGGVAANCPPGKVGVLQDGEVRCIVKERVEIPFDSVADNADVNYGCG